MDTILPYALLCFTSFFTLTNPLGTMPVFLTMTNGLEEKGATAYCEKSYNYFFYYTDCIYILRAVLV